MLIARFVLIMSLGQTPAALSGRIAAEATPSGTVRLLPAAPAGANARAFRFNAKPVGTAVLGPKGEFHFATVARGDYELSWERGAGTFDAHVKVKAPATAVVVQDPKGAQLAGRIIDIVPPRKPAASAQLSMAPGGEESHHADVAADGTFTFRGLEFGTYELEVLRGSSVMGVCRRVEVVVKSDRASVEVRFGAGWKLEGTLVDVSGKPAPSEFVKVREGGRQDVCSSRNVMTDSSGRFVVEDLVGEEVEVVIGTKVERVRRGAPPLKLKTP